MSSSFSRCIGCLSRFDRLKPARFPQRNKPTLNDLVTHIKPDRNNRLPYLGHLQNGDSRQVFSFEG